MTNIKEVWKDLSNRKVLTSSDMAFLCLYKSLTKEDTSLASAYLKSSFTPITNQRKLENGHFPWFGLWDALRSINDSQLMKYLTDEEREQIKILANSFKGSFGKVNL